MKRQEERNIVFDNDKACEQDRHLNNTFATAAFLCFTCYDANAKRWQPSCIGNVVITEVGCDYFLNSILTSLHFHPNSMFYWHQCSIVVQ
jgi:hypothetical protein